LLACLLACLRCVGEKREEENEYRCCLLVCLLACLLARLTYDFDESVWEIQCKLDGLNLDIAKPKMRLLACLLACMHSFTLLTRVFEAGKCNKLRLH